MGASGTFILAVKHEPLVNLKQDLLQRSVERAVSFTAVCICHLLFLKTMKFIIFKDTEIPFSGKLSLSVFLTAWEKGWCTVILKK